MPLARRINKKESYHINNLAWEGQAWGHWEMKIHKDLWDKMEKQFGQREQNMESAAF